MALVAIEIARMCLQLGIGFALENPITSLLWALPPMVELMKEAGVYVISLDYCVFGEAWRKTTQLITTAPELRAIGRRCAGTFQRCSRTHQPHQVLRGFAPTGEAWTKLACPYPLQFCDEYATLLISRAPLVDTGEGIRKRLKPQPRKHNGKMMSQVWLDPKRWSLLFKGTFAQEEHNNILELRGVVAVLRHLNRSSRVWSSRVLVFTDSLVSLGALAKGRSSARQILRMCRAAAAVELACEIKLILRWVPSELNFADGPSRGGPIWGRPRHSSQSSSARSPEKSFEVVRSLSAGARPARKTLVIILLSVCALGVQGMPKQRQPLLKKGPLAWDNAKHFRPVHNNRLIIHAVDDATNLLYAKSVMPFLMECRRHRVPFATLHDRDKAMGRFLEDQCYVNHGSVNAGKSAFFGFLHIFEEHRDQMPIARRALKAWERMAEGGEGGPMAKETVAVIFLKLLAGGWFLEAIVVILSFDCFLREQDWEMLIKSDVAIDNTGRTALLFGVRERGQKVKTGTNHGVIVEHDLARRLLHAALEGLDQADRVFPFSAQSFRKVWWAALRDLSLEHCGPPHNLRHSGAAHFVEQGGDIELCRRRGRWLAASSVQRYTKTHWLVRHRARMQPTLLRLGASFWNTPGRCMDKVLRHHGSRSPIARRIADAGHKTHNNKKKDKIDDTAWAHLLATKPSDFVETDADNG